jgi:hypothetical protein
MSWLLRASSGKPSLLRSTLVRTTTVSLAVSAARIATSGGRDEGSGGTRADMPHAIATMPSELVTALAQVCDGRVGVIVIQDGLVVPRCSLATRIYANLANQRE